MDAMWSAFVGTEDLIRVQVFWDDTLSSALLCDLSPHGASFFVNEPGDSGSCLLLLAPGAEANRPLFVRVERVESHGPFRRVQARFASLDQLDSAFLTSWLARTSFGDAPRVWERMSRQRAA
jgi:hypothetical protein